MEKENEDEKSKTKTVLRQAAFSKKLVDFKGVIHTFPEALGPGDYTFPFEFTLPRDLPSTIVYSNNDLFSSPQAKVEYLVGACLKLHTREEMNYTQMLIVNEPPVQYRENLSEERSAKLANCCCTDKGKATVKAKFQKNNFLPNETI